MLEKAGGGLADLIKQGVSLNQQIERSRIAFTTYRAALSQRENHTVIFILIGAILVLQRGRIAALNAHTMEKASKSNLAGIPR